MTEQHNELTNSQYVSLAAIMLLAPIIPLAIRTNDIVLTDEEKMFVDGWIFYGKRILGFFGAGGIFRIGNGMLPTKTILYYLSQGCNSIAIAGICVGIVSIYRNISLIKNNRIHTQGIRSLFYR